MKRLEGNRNDQNAIFASKQLVQEFVVLGSWFLVLSS